MDKEPRRLGERMLEFAVLFALSALLLKLGVWLLMEIWWVLLIVAIAVAGIILWVRARHNQDKW